MEIDAGPAASGTIYRNPSASLRTGAERPLIRACHPAVQETWTETTSPGGKFVRMSAECMLVHWSAAAGLRDLSRAATEGRSGSTSIPLIGVRATKSLFATTCASDVD